MPWRPEASCRSQDDLFLTGYLRSELLTHLAPELVSFMTRTAVLDRMCGPLAIAVARRSPARLVSFLALFWMTGGLLMLRFALAIGPRPGFRLGLAAAIAAVVGAGLVLLRDRLSGLVAPEVFVGLLGIAAVLTGLLRPGIDRQERSSNPRSTQRLPKAEEGVWFRSWVSQPSRRGTL